VSRPVKILFVEDSDDDTQLALRILQRGGFEPTHRRVQTAADLETALAGERWDAVISDFNLPGFTGIDALGILRATSLDIPFILISGAVGEEIAVHAMKAGANDYIVKMNLSRLASVLQRELQEADNRAVHKRAEEKRREAAQLLHNIVENIPTAVQLKSVKDGFRIQMWNKAAEAMYGLPRHAVIGRTVHEIWPESDADRMHASDLDLALNKTMLDFPDRLAQTKNRGDIRVHMRKVALCDAAGNATHLLVIADDMTAQLADQERVRASEQRLRTVIETEPECVKVVNNQMVLVDMNPAGLAMLEADLLAQVQARPLTDFILPEYRPAFADLHARVMSGESGNLEFEVVGLKGGRRWLETHAAPLGGKDGKAAMLIGVTRDITESKEAVRKLHESEARFRSLTELSTDWFWEQDEDYRFVSFSGGQGVSGWGPDQEKAVGLRRWELGGVMPISCTWDEHRALLAARKPYRSFEYQRILGDGRLQYVEASGEPVFDTGGRFTGYRGVATEITVRKAAEVRIKRLNRVHAMLSGINSAIVRNQERNGLFAEVCRLAVAEGGFILARVIEVTPDGKARIAATSESDARLFQGIVDEYNDDPEHSASMLAVALRTNQTMVSNDVAGDPRIPNRAALTKEGNYALALLPIIVERRTVGTVILRSREAGLFDVGEMHLLSEVVSNLSFALEHIGKEEKVKRLTRVYAVLSGINTLIVRVRDREVLFREACQIAVEHGRFQMAWIGTVDQDQKRIVPAASAGANQDFLATIWERFSLEESSPTGNSLTARAVRSRRVMISNDIQKESIAIFGKQHLERGTRSMAILPLLISDAVIGVLALYSNETGFFDDEEVTLLTELAGDIAFAADNIDKAHKLARVTRVNAMLSGINGAIVRIRGRQELFEEACRIAVETGGLPFAWMGVADASGTHLQLVASAGNDDGFLQTIRDRLAIRDAAPEAQALSVRAIRDRRVVVLNDVAADPLLSRRRAFANRGINSLAVFPLLVAGRAVGAFALHAEQTGFFDADEMKLLNEVAGNIAFALEHIDKEEKVRRLTRVHAVLSGTNSLIVRARNREELLKEACRIAVEIGGFSVAWIGIVDRPSMRIVPAGSAGGNAELIGAINDIVSLPGGDNPASLAIEAKRPFVSNDSQSDLRVALRKLHAESGIRSMAVLPLISGDEALGALALYSAENAFFDDEELKLLGELAGDIAFALENIGKQERLDYLAFYDEVTGLANRRLFLERVGQYMRIAVAGGHKLAVFFVDLERFRNINESLGRPAGDALLKQVSDWLSRSVGDPNLLARLGADHFAIVLPEIKPTGNVAGLLDKRLRAFVDHPFRLKDTELRINVKAGAALFPEDGTDADTLLRNAEAALKKAKARGDRYLFYKQKMNETAAGKLTLENQLRQALEREEFVLHYQPKVNLESGKLTSAEALIRWNDPRTGLVPPGRFIPVLEETGLIQDVGRWALRKAIEDYLRWRGAGLPAVRISVNVSPLQLRNRVFVAEVQQATGIDPHAAAGLELEITESLIMEDVKHSIAILTAIRAMGVTVAIDDFGTGFSSLSYLAKLPVDTLKIDRSFVIDMTAGPEGLALVSTIINLAHSLRLKVVAEGVETEEQSRLLRLLRCDEMQGFLFSKPVPADIFEAKFLAAAGA
jgi:diguanylate cyclase (GGDEF)-like protein/PAS domain S-box-containing protein